MVTAHDIHECDTHEHHAHVHDIHECDDHEHHGDERRPRS